MKKEAKELLDSFENFLEKIEKMESCNIKIHYQIQAIGKDQDEIINGFNKIIDKHGIRG